MLALRNTGEEPWKGAVVEGTGGTNWECIICNKEMGWPLPPVPKRQPLNPWNFPSIIHGGSLGPHLMVYANKVAQEGSWSPQKDQAHGYRIGTSSNMISTSPWG